jgi:hypothetical protein
MDWDVIPFVRSQKLILLVFCYIFPILKLFQIKLIHLNEIYILYYTHIIFVRWTTCKKNKLDLRFMSGQYIWQIQIKIKYDRELLIYSSNMIFNQNLVSSLEIKHVDGQTMRSKWVNYMHFMQMTYTNVK